MKKRTALVLSMAPALLLFGAVFLLKAQQPAAASNPAVDLRNATTKWLASLNPEQRVEAKVRYDDHARFDWQFVPRPKRKGLPLSEMDIRQKRLAIDVLKLAYSAAGFEKIEKIRDQQNYLHEKQNQDPPHCCGNYGNA